MCSGYFFLERNFILRIFLSGMDFLFLFPDFHFRNTIISFSDFFSGMYYFSISDFFVRNRILIFFPDFYFRNSIITSGFIFLKYIIFNSGFLFPELRVFLAIKKICWVQVKNDWVQGAFAYFFFPLVFFVPEMSGLRLILPWIFLPAPIHFSSYTPIFF